MIKFNHLWYLLHICCDFAILVNPFFGAVFVQENNSKKSNVIRNDKYSNEGKLFPDKVKINRIQWSIYNKRGARSFTITF